MSFGWKRAVALWFAVLLASGNAQAQDTAEVKIAEARTLLAEGRTDEAIAAFEAAVRLEPGNAAARNALGSLLNSSGRYVEALPHAEAAVALDPINGRYRYNRGVVLAEHGRFREAVADFDLALTSHPDMAYAYLERGAAQFSLGQTAAARRDWGQARLAEPELIWTRWYPATADLVEGNYAEAAAGFDRVAASEPGFAAAHVWRSIARARAGTPIPPAIAHGRDWPAPVLELYRGSLNAAQLLAIAEKDKASGDDRRLGEALYFIGQRDLIAGKAGSAAAYFKRALAVDAPRHVWKISAEQELQRLQR